MNSIDFPAVSGDVQEEEERRKAEKAARDTIKERVKKCRQRLRGFHQAQGFSQLMYYVCLYIHLLIYIYIYTYVFIKLCIYLFIYLSIYLFIYLFIYCCSLLHIYIYIYVYIDVYMSCTMYILYLLQISISIIIIDMMIHSDMSQFLFEGYMFCETARQSRSM